MCDGGVLMTALFLLLAAVAVWWALGHRQPWRQHARSEEIPKRAGVQGRGSRRSRGAPAAPRCSRPRATPGKRPRAPASPLDSPCSCGPCLAVAQQLRESMLLLWARNGTREPLYSGMWQALCKELEELLKRGHLPCCASCSSSRSLHPRKRLLPARTTIPGRASALATMAHRQRSAIRARASGCQRSSTVPGASLISDSLQPCQRLSETCQPAPGAEPADRSPSSPGLPDVTETGASPSTAVAGESPQVQVGAQPEAREPSQEQVAEQQVCRSQQLPAPGSQEAVPAVPAGSSPCLAAETMAKRPRRFLRLQEAAPRRPPRITKAFAVTGEIL